MNDVNAHYIFISRCITRAAGREIKRNLFKISLPNMKERLTNHINCNLIGLDNHMKHRRQTFLENFKVCCKYFEFRFWVEWTEDIYCVNDFVWFRISGLACWTSWTNFSFHLNSRSYKIYFYYLWRQWQAIKRQSINFFPALCPPSTT